MNKKTKSFLIIIISLITVIFLVLNILWFAYRYKCFVKVVNANSDCVEIPSDSRKIYDLTPDKNKSINDFDAQIFFPRYLKFTGNYGVSQAVYMSDDGSGYLNDYHVYINIHPHLFGKTEFRIDVQDYTKNDMINYTFDVTNNLEVIKNYSFDPSEVLENPDSKALIDKAMETAEKYSLTD